MTEERVRQKLLGVINEAGLEIIELESEQVAFKRLLGLAIEFDDFLEWHEQPQPDRSDPKLSSSELLQAAGWFLEVANDRKSCRQSSRKWRPPSVPPEMESITHRLKVGTYSPRYRAESILFAVDDFSVAAAAYRQYPDSIPSSLDWQGKTWPFLYEEFKVKYRELCRGDSFAVVGRMLIDVFRIQLMFAAFSMQ